jgi:hypothetical protein
MNPFHFLKKHQNRCTLLPTPPPPYQSKRTVQCTYTQTVCGCGGVGGGVLSCVVDHILQEFNTLFLTRLRIYKIATPPKQKHQ